ncbi:MAG: thymidylate synthase [Acidiferrobacteraceae bacterium]
MRHPELPYLLLLEDILRNGSARSDRTGVGTMAVFGRELRFRMADGFPAITTKKLAFKSVVGELIGFLRGYDNAAQFRSLGCTIWDQNANENAQWLANPHRRGPDDLGMIYVVQWRRLPMPDGSTKDQIADLIQKLRSNPTDRRLIVWAYNPAWIDHMALPPCHMGFQCFVDHGKLSMKMEMRSVDTFLGMPFNIASYALLLHLLAQVVNLEPDELILSFGDTHLYRNHLAQVEEQLARDPLPWPTLKLNPDIRDIDEFGSDDVQLEDYQCHAPIRAPMAV